MWTHCQYKGSLHLSLSALFCILMWKGFIHWAPQSKLPPIPIYQLPSIGPNWELVGIQVLIINAASLWFVRIRGRNYVSCSCLSAWVSPNHASPLMLHPDAHTPTHAVTYRKTCLWWDFCRMSFVLPKCAVAYKVIYIRTIEVTIVNARKFQTCAVSTATCVLGQIIIMLWYH